MKSRKEKKNIDAQVSSLVTEAVLIHVGERQEKVMSLFLTSFHGTKREKISCMQNVLFSYTMKNQILTAESDSTI